MLLNDLRAILLEIAGGPPRLRADASSTSAKSTGSCPSLTRFQRGCSKPWSGQPKAGSARQSIGPRVLELVNEVCRRPGRPAPAHLRRAPMALERTAQNNMRAHPAFHPASAARRALRRSGRRVLPASSRPARSSRTTRGSSGNKSRSRKWTNRGEPIANWGIVAPSEKLSLRPHVDRAFAALKPGSVLPAEQRLLAPGLRRAQPA